jgi:WD40 repeat protein/ABC-type dipeptide/oligopeptide/nickel transport system ATPase subunit
MLNNINDATNHVQNTVILGDISEVETPGIPYKGLNPYDETDSHIFFGRKKDVQKVINELLVWPLTILYGKSGVGKSSLLRAGVAHLLNKETQQILKEEEEEHQQCSDDDDDFDISPKLLVVVFPSLDRSLSWQSNPLMGLKQQIQSTISHVGLKIPSPEQNLCLADTLEGWTKSLGGEEKNGKLCIILDQFEEYFLYHYQTDLKEEFAIELAHAINSDLPVNFLVSIRDDSFSKLDYFKRYIPDLFKHTIGIQHLTWKSAYQAVAEPVMVYGKEFPNKKVELESRLIKAVLKGVNKFVPNENGCAGVKQVKSKTKAETEKSSLEVIDSNLEIETPYLQLVMTRLWEEMNPATRCLDLSTLTNLADQRLKDEKKIQNAIKRIFQEHLDSALSLLSTNEKDILAKLFQYLVTPSGTKYAYSISDLYTICVSEDDEELEFTELELITLLEKLASGKHRIICPLPPLPNQPAEARRFEIFHDVLAQPILNWRRRYLAKKQRLQERDAAKQLRIRLVKQGLATQSLRQQRRRKDELAALLALQAYHYNKQEKLYVLEQVDDALRQALSAPHFSQVVKHLESGFGWDSSFSSITFSADGTKLAAACLNSNIYLWDRSQGYSELKFIDAHEGGVKAIAFSPDGQWLASGGLDKKVKLWSMAQESDTPQVLGNHDKSVTSITFSSDGNLLVTGSEDQTVKLWHWQQPEQTPIVLAGHQKKGWMGIVRSLAMSQDASQLAVGCDDRRVWIWNVNDPAKTPDIEPIVRYGHEEMVCSVAFSPDGQTLASASDDHTIRLWDTTQHEAPPKTLQGHKARVQNLAFSPDGNLLASAGYDETIRLWQMDCLDEAPQILRGHTFNINGIAFSPEGQVLASCAWDNTVRLWNLRPPEARPVVLKGHQDTVRSLAVSGQGIQDLLLASGSNDGTVKVWQLNAPQNPPRTFEHLGRVFGVALFVNSARTAQLLAASCDDRKVRLWNLQQPSDDPLKTFEGHQDGVGSVAFSPDGQLLASGSWQNDASIRVWDLHHPNQEPLLFEGYTDKGHTDSITAVKFSPDGAFLASASDDKTVRIWNLKHPNTDPLILKDHSSRVWSIAFSPDGQLLASASDDWTVRLWNLQTLDREHPVHIRLKGHSAWVSSVAFSPDGKALASGSFDCSIRLWQINQVDWKKRTINEDPIVLEDHEQSVTSVAFTPDGKYLISSGYDNTVRLWIASTDVLAGMVCQKVLRNLTLREWQQFIGGDIPYELTCPDLPIREGDS